MSGTVKATGYSTSPRSWSTPTSVISTRESSPRCRSRRPSSARSLPSTPTRPVRKRLGSSPSTPPGDLNKIFFTNGGADANEHAVRMARLHTGRYKVLTRYRSYHGGTETAINLTGDPRRWRPTTTATAVSCTSSDRSCIAHTFTPPPRRRKPSALAHLEDVIRLEGPSTIAAIVLESIPGTAGIMFPPTEYLAGVRELCDRYGIVFIADEVMAGFGRSGKWFAVDHFDVTPGASRCVARAAATDTAADREHGSGGARRAHNNTGSSRRVGVLRSPIHFGGRRTRMHCGPAAVLDRVTTCGDSGSRWVARRSP